MLDEFGEPGQKAAAVGCLAGGCVWQLFWLVAPIVGAVVVIKWLFS